MKIAVKQERLQTSATKYYKVKTITWLIAKI
jgi:hypothetical protein